MKKLLLCSLLTMAMTIAAAAADISGKWSGTFTREGRDPSSAYAVIKQTGTAIIGTAGPSENEQWPGLTGAIKGDKVTFEVKSASDGRLYKCDMVLAGDHLKGDVTASTPDGQSLKAKMDLSRVK